jgi:ABC-type polysaccharide/polyol phosphate export permease
LHSALAIARIYTRSMLTYRTRTLVSLVSTLVAIFPIYYVAAALRDFAARAVQGHAPDYFGYVIVGSIGVFVVTEAASSIPSIVNSYINSGMLEQLLGTPARWPSVLAGVSMYGFAWVALRALIVLATAWILGQSLHWVRLPEAVLVFALVALVVLPVGLAGAACVLVTRSTLWLPQVAITGATLFGSVYFPATALPPALTWIGEAMPLTPALAAARKLLLLDAPIADVLPLLGPVALWAVGGLLVGGGLFAAALRHARRAGTLTQY